MNQFTINVQATISKELITVDTLRPKDYAETAYGSLIRIHSLLPNGKIKDTRDKLHDAQQLTNRIVRLKASMNVVDRNNTTKPIQTDVDYNDYFALYDVTKPIDGIIETFKNKVNMHDSVSISSLRIVDKYKLYDKELRYGTITNIVSHNKFEITLNSGVVLTLNRGDFELKRDSKLVFRLVCQECNK